MAQIRNSRSSALRTSNPRGQKADKNGQRSGDQRVKNRAGAHVLNRRAPSQERARDTVDAVVQAAEKLLVEEGYGRASTNAIARRAGVSVGSVYQYFSDKDAIFRAVVLRHREDVIPVILGALDRIADGRSEVVEGVVELLRDMARVNARDPKLMLAIEGELGWLEHEDDSPFDLHWKVEQILRLRTSVPPEELRVTAELMVAALTPLSRWLVHRKPAALDTEQFLRGVARMLNGLLLRA